jgi:hypothetical protein
MMAKCALYGWLGILTLLVGVPSIAAQTAATGALVGTVTDSTGAVVPSVTVTATSADTGQARTTTTGQDGSYKFGLLPPGTYRVKFEAPGLKTIEIPSIEVNVTETPVLNRTLEVGTQAQEVTVQGEVETVQTSNATVGTIMASQTITNLPLTTRNYTTLLGLSAGASAPVFHAATFGRGTEDIAVNGGNTTQNNFQMDGVSINVDSGTGSAVDAQGNAGIGIANPDAIQEFKIQTSQYDAGYGRAAGANVNVVTKSGTNQFHGTAFEFFRNTDLNANDFFRKESPPINGVPNDGRQVLNSNQFGGVLGGPVKKDKLFFFTSYQETRQRNGVAPQGFSSPVLVPVPAGDRSNTAAFQAALGGIFCPTGTDGGKSGAGGTQVACNGSNINPVAINILQLKNPDGSYYIPGSSTGANQNNTFSIPAQYTEHQFIGNADYIINDKNTLSGRYFYSATPTNISFFCGNSSPISTGPPPGICLPDTGILVRYTADTAAMRLTSILTNNLVNEARVSLQRTISQQHATVPFTDSQVGIAPISPNVNSFDQITISGLFTIGTQANGPKFSNAWEVADQISWTHEKHTIRAGFEFERDRINQHAPGNSIGALTFQTFQDFLLGLPGCSPSLSAAACAASAAAGVTNGSSTSNISNSGLNSSATVGGVGVINAWRLPAADAFVQDDIRIKPRLTVNLGMRWEYDGIIMSKYGDATNVWPSLVETVPVPGSTPATGTLAGFVVPSNFNFANNPPPPVAGLFQNNQTIGTKNNVPIDDFAPRVGYAWQPLATDRFAVRGGFGYFYQRLTQANYSSVYAVAPPYDLLIGNSGAANFASSLAQPLPAVGPGWPVRWVNFANGTSSNIPAFTMAENYLTPLTYSWNLNLQYEVAPSWVLEVGYVGAHGIHQAVVTREIDGAPLASPSNPINGITTSTVANASLRVPYLGFSPSAMSDSDTTGSYKFNSLQATLRKTLSHGLQLQAAYTWLKDLSTGIFNNGNSNNPDNNGQQYGPDASYRPQRLALNYSWDLPFGKQEGFKGKLMNGWNVSGVTIVQGGAPQTITDTRGGTVYGFGPGTNVTSRAQFAAGMGPANVATPGSVEARLGAYFNKAAFSVTPVLGSDGKATGYGNSGVGIILGPGQFNWDMSLVKTTTVGGLREDAALQFRTEFFNTFNHGQFNAPLVDDVSKSTFGQITTTSVNPRVIQFALKYLF